MRVPADSSGYQNLAYISRDAKILNQVKLSEGKTSWNALISAGFTSSQNTLQAVNTTILRLMQTIGRANESVQFSQQNIDLEKTVAALVENLNEVLRIINESTSNDIATNKNISIAPDCLLKLKGIIVSVLKTNKSLNEIFKDFSSLGIKLMQDDSLSLDNKTLHEAISSNPGEAARSVKTIAGTLFETLPLCIDPNSGALVYTGRRLEDSGDDTTAKVLATLSEELEKERTELEKRLSIADLLISHSNNLIDGLKPQVEALPCDE
jgi:molybdopterin converting factor small subunit